MDKILVSACLLGQPVRYDGAAKTCANAHLVHWQAEGRLLAFCPEVAGGFATPRLAAEIEPGAGAGDVLAGHARIIDSDGNDVTAGFLAGAQATLKVAQDASCHHAILTDGSPSCGTGFIYAGGFDNSQKPGMGVTAALLVRHRIRVWSDTKIDNLASFLATR